MTACAAFRATRNARQSAEDPAETRRATDLAQAISHRTNLHQSTRSLSGAGSAQAREYPQAQPAPDPQSPGKLPPFSARKGGNGRRHGGRDQVPCKDTNMSTNNFTSTQDQMKSVKAAWDKAPSGPKKDAALTHYQAAEKAHTAKNDADCVKSLDAATRALA